MGNESVKQDVARILLANAIYVAFQGKVREILRDFKPLIHGEDSTTRRDAWAMIVGYIRNAADELLLGDLKTMLDDESEEGMRALYRFIDDPD